MNALGRKGLKEHQNAWKSDLLTQNDENVSHSDLHRWPLESSYHTFWEKVKVFYLTSHKLRDKCAYRKDFFSRNCSKSNNLRFFSFHW